MFNALLKLICIAVGGGFGALFRFWLSEFIYQKGKLPGWVATVLVNLLGSVIIGFAFSVYTEEMLRTTMQDGHFPYLLRLELLDLQLLFALTATGFCGGLTTFSAFSIDTFVLYRQGKVVQAASNVLISVSLGVLAVLAGLWLGYLYEH